MAESMLTYFSCTLSEALRHNIGRGARAESSNDGVIISNEFFEDINGFVDFLALKYEDRIAVGYMKSTGTTAKSQKDTTDGEVLTFEEIRRGSIKIGNSLEKQLRETASQSEWIALLATSSPLFLLVWLGLLRCGFKVLLVAPQSSSQTIQHLIKLSGAITIIHDARYRATAREAVGPLARNDHSANENPNRPIAHCLEIPWTSVKDALNTLSSTADDTVNSSQYIGRSVDVIYAFHSSGTTGPPKLIPQTNHGAVGVLPLMQDGHRDDEIIPATYTTTPLYSGGIADILRSWSAAAPLWLFPEGHVPITATNILSCIHQIDDLCRERQQPSRISLDYLSCVPFVLESMMQHPPAMQRLCKMVMVGVGGAAMSNHLGDQLVAAGVPLLSRFGSSENGFLLSSNRDFESDKQWNVLRCSGENDLDFRQLDSNNDRYELIVPRTWPLVSKASHAQRPFNTHDVFIPHGDMLNAWYYKGRSDAQLTLRTGRKFDPTEMETLLRVSGIIDEAIVVGEGQTVAAAILFGSNDVARDEVQTRQVISNLIVDANSKVAKYARLQQQYVKFLPSSEVSRIPRNNKGGVIRSSFASEFKNEIATLYDGSDESNETMISVDVKSRTSVLEAVKSIVKDQLQLEDKLRVGDDLFEAGLDSQGCIAISQCLKSCTGISDLHLGVVYECGTIESLANYVSDALTSTEQSDTKATILSKKGEEMLALVDEYTRPQTAPQDFVKYSDSPLHHDKLASKNKVFLLTGATGFLGIHILNQLLRDESVAQIFVFIRGSSLSSDQQQQVTAKARLGATLSYHRLLDSKAKEAMRRKLTFVPFFIKHDNLGISEHLRTEIIATVTHVIHAAWEVNFNLSLKAFNAHIRGAVSLFNLTVLAAQRRQQQLSYTFCSSLASIQNAAKDHTSTLDQDVSHEPADAAAIGYGQSKWVAERVLHTLSQQNPEINVSILRVGQLSADTTYGIWNHREAWPLMIDASITAVPRNQNQHSDIDNHDTQRCIFPDIASTNCNLIDWVPVNHAATAVLNSTITQTNKTMANCKIKPIVNRQHTTTWTTIQGYIQAWMFKNGYEFELIHPQQWLDRLETSPHEHQAKALLPLWRQNWTTDTNDLVVDQVAVAHEPHETISQLADATFSPSAASEEPGDSQVGYVLDADYFERLLAWITHEYA